MSNAAKSYLRGLNDEFSYLGTWLPNGEVRLGDVGVQNGAEWKRVTSLANLGVPFGVRAGKQPIDFTHTSSSGVKLGSKVKATAGSGAVAVQGGLTIDFSEEGAFVFRAAQCRVDEVDDHVALGNALMKLCEQGRWELEWSVVDTLVTAESATVLVSNSKTSALELGAKSPLALASLADASAGISITAQSGDVTHFIAAKGLTPLFKLSRLKKSIFAALFGKKPITFGGPTRSQAEPPPVTEDPLERVSPDY